MFKLKSEQKIFDIAGVKVGGQPGQLPTVMLGSIFYHKEKILKNEKTGEIDREKAEELLNQEREVSNKTGNPRIVDVCCSLPETFEKLIDFVAQRIEGPFSIDGTTPEVKIAGARHVGESGLSNRVVYNSITPYTTEEEILTLKEAKIKSAILLALNSRNPTISGRLDVLDSILSLAAKAGIENTLIDAAVLDVPDPGPVAKTIHLIKEKRGLPVGAGTHNAVERWNDARNLNSTQRLLAGTVANVLPIAMGADFLLYGPIENATNSYFISAVADAYLAYSMRQEFHIQPLNRIHPLFRIFRV
jgi:tetrahydromethanopterin S-methyltransferase subunit H